jgi:small-conductance mechanosensitive channel
LIRQPKFELPYAYINLYELYAAQGRPEQSARVAEAFREYHAEMPLPQLILRLKSLRGRPQAAKALIREVIRSREPSLGSH